MEIPTRFGMTHVVTSGPKDAPPLVLLHGMSMTLTMWSANVADFSKEYRVYTVDVMGQPGKSIPDPAEDGLPLGAHPDHPVVVVPDPDPHPNLLVCIAEEKSMPYHALYEHRASQPT